MNAKILLIALSAAAFSSCSTAYKSGQTPDDVYYSPVRVVDERRNDDSRDDTRQVETTSEDKRIRMSIYDPRWRNLDYDYDYSYNYSPYSYYTCTCNSYGYYYNPYYYSRPVYYPTVITKTAVNTTPRMVNLNSYKNYNNAVTNNNPKTSTSSTWVNPTRQYNNSNNSGSKIGNVLRQVFTPSPNTNSNTNSSSNNNTRTYTPSSNSSSGSSGGGGSSSGGGSSGSVARPGRGG